VTRKNVRLILGLIVLVVIVKNCRAGDNEMVPQESRDEQLLRDLDQQLKPEGNVEVREGLAAAIAIDVSGSMAEKVKGSDGSRQAKIEIARSAALDLVDQFAAYAREHKDEPVQLAIYEFSRRSGLADARPVIEMGPPDRAKAAEAVAKLAADGGTPIGQAMIIAKLALDRTGLTRRHLLVVTDGENTDGVKPDSVAVAMNKRPDAERPSIYFVAFDVEANRFSGVKDAGGLVLSAANAKELNETLDMLLGKKILIEK
jgi:Mg-chelatase subunit ChlD